MGTRMSETMRAGGTRDYGGPDALEPLREPVPGAGELLLDGAT